MNMTKKTKPNYLSLLSLLFFLVLGLIFSTFLLISVIQYYSFNQAYFRDQFQKNQIAAATGLNDSQLDQVIRQMTGYLANKESSFNLTLTINGQETLVFNTRELAHMLDVKVIYIILARIKDLTLLLLLAFITPYSLYVYRQARKHRNAKTLALQRSYWVNLSKILIFNGAFTLVLIGGLGFMVLTNFSKYFILFHEVFFDNDLWLLNPQTDRLIQMLPENFFYDISFQMIRTYATLSLSLGVMGLIFFLVQTKEDSR